MKAKTLCHYSLSFTLALLAINSYGQIQQAEGIIAAGEKHTLVLCSDGNVWGVGRQNGGVLGNSASGIVNTPIQVLSTGNIKFIDAAWDNSTALDVDGNVWVWGLNYRGELGVGNTNVQSTPVKVSSLANSLKAVASGWIHTLFLKIDGTVWASGRNDFGELGDGTTTDKSSPTKVPGLTDVEAISGGKYHSLALKSDGTVWTWGTNFSGLGNGTTQSTSPVQVSGLTNIIKIVSLQNHSLALKNDGTVWAWGQGDDGQLGNGSMASSSTPVQVSGLNNVADIGSGGGHSIALKNDSTVWVWGTNINGQLGNGSTQELLPVQLNLSKPVIAIAAGYNHTVVTLNDGTVWGCGYNGYGQLGGGSTADVTTMTPIAFSCSGSSTNLINEQVNSFANISIYPNPSDDGRFTFQFQNPENEFQTIEVYSSEGQLIMMDSSKGGSSKRIDLSTYSSGIYFYKIVSKSEYRSGKMLVGY